MEILSFLRNQVQQEVFNLQKFDCNKKCHEQLAQNFSIRTLKLQAILQLRGFLPGETEMPFFNRR